MICKVISKRIQKLELGDSYRRQFQRVLESIQRRYRSMDSLSKGYIIKKLCTKYLKSCNSLILIQPIQSSLSALQFIKSLQLDIYDGKSYQLYLIKITLHILYVRCFDIKLQQLRRRDVMTIVKKRNYQQQEREWRRRRYRYIERLGMFCVEIEQCYFSTYLLKDYYSNLQQLYFLCLKHQMRKVVDEFVLHNTKYYQFQDSFQLTQVTYYIDKLYQLLKNHMLELNQMLIYEQKKVYEILVIKINFMVDTFVIEAVVKFVEYADEERMSRSRAQQFSEIRGIKEKFLDQQIQHLWQKYNPLFSKMPNHVDQQLIYNQFSQIIQSFTSRSYNHNVFTDKVDTNKSYSIGDFSKNFSRNNSGSKSQIQQDTDLNDIISFGQQTVSIKQINSSKSLDKQKIEPFSKLKTKGQENSNMKFQEKRKKRQQNNSLPTTQQKGLTNNLSSGFASDGFRKLNSLKTPSLNMLQKMKETQFQRLRRVNSTDLIRTLKTPLLQPLRKLSEKKKERRSKTQYFPFIGESKQSSGKDLLNQLNNSFKRNSSTSSNKFNFPFRQSEQTSKSKKSKPKQVLKLNPRSINKRTTLDMTIFERHRNSFDQKEQNEIILSKVKKIFSFAQVLAKQDLGENLQLHEF